MTILQDFLPYLNIVLMLCLAIGGVFAWRRGYSQESNTIQVSTIDALKEEVASLRRKVDDLEKERSTQDRVIATIRYALKSQGLRVTIQGDFVTLADMTGKSKVTRIQERLMVQPAGTIDDDSDAV